SLFIASLSFYFFFFFFSFIPLPPTSTLFPYTTPLPIFARSSYRHRGARGPRIHVLPRDCGCRESCRDGPAVVRRRCTVRTRHRVDRKSTRLNSSHVAISYAVFCLKKKKNQNTTKLC